MDSLGYARNHLVALTRILIHATAVMSTHVSLTSVSTSYSTPSITTLHLLEFTRTDPFSQAIHVTADRAHGKTPFLEGTGHGLVEDAVYPSVRVGFPKLHRPRSLGRRQQTLQAREVAERRQWRDAEGFTRTS